MSIKPIDIQTLFVKLTDVGKNQANIKTAAMVSRNVEAREQAEEEIRKEHSVNQVSDENDISKLNSREEDKRHDKEDPNELKEEESDTTKPSKPDLFVSLDDPDVGNNIDVKS